MKWGRFSKTQTLCFRPELDVSCFTAASNKIAAGFFEKRPQSERAKKTMSLYYTPIYDSVKKYTGTKPVAFHMPGHKLGKGIPEKFIKDLYMLDITEIPGLDNLHHPQEAILEAQELAANAFGARKTFFLVNGSTCGIHAMILSVCKPGDKLIVARDCHKAVIGGMMLAGVEPVYIKPGYIKEFGIPGAISPADVESAVNNNPDAVGVFITRPNYYGICCDLKKIAEIVHAKGKVLLVDEAHGAHLKFHEQLPDCAMDSGADICVQSAHKTLPAFTQSAYLHVGSDRVDIEKVVFNLGVLQTSSPSYILMAFLDIARAIMEQDGRERIEGLLGEIEVFEKQLEEIPGLTLLKDASIENGCLDRTRVAIRMTQAGLTGYEAERLLREKHDIQVEMADLNNIVCISTIADGRAEFEKLKNSLKNIIKPFIGKQRAADINIRELNIPEKGLSLKDITYAKALDIPLKDSAGRICMVLVTPYPPGIPLICPGEIITVEMVEYISNIINCGGNVNGLSASREIKVVK